MKCPGLHCDGCGGGKGMAVLAVLAVIIVAAAARAAAPAVLSGLELALIIAGAVVTVGCVAGVTVLLVLARRESLARWDGTRRTVGPAVRVLPARRPGAIEPRRAQIPGQAPGRGAETSGVSQREGAV